MRKWCAGSCAKRRTCSSCARPSWSSETFTDSVAPAPLLLGVWVGVGVGVGRGWDQVGVGTGRDRVGDWDRDTLRTYFMGWRRHESGICFTITLALTPRFYDMLELFNIAGKPPFTNYLFLGEYARGSASL